MQLFPHYCLLCEQPVDRRIDLCQPCEDSLPWNLRACARCAGPVASPDPGKTMPAPVPAVVCTRCVLTPPVCSRTVAPFLYRDAIAVWIRQFKFRQGWRAGKVLAELVASAIGSAVSPGAPMPGVGPDAIVPIPLSRWRLLRRGHNQAHAIARGIARRLDLPLRHDLLRRGRHTRAQAGLPRSERNANVARAFVASPAASGQRIALVDDVCTTGATLTAATRALIAAGALDVMWWVAARTPESQESGSP